MNTTIDSEAAILFVTFDGAEEQARFLSAAIEQGALMLPLDEPLELRGRWTVQLKSRDAGGVSLDAEVVHRFESPGSGHQTAFELRGWDAERVRALLEGAGVAPPGAVAAEESAESARAAAPVEGEAGGETLGVSPAHRIAELNPNQRAMLAPKAGRVDRQILLRDRSHLVLQGLLANPRLEAKEAVRIAKSRHATGALLQRLAGDARWNKNLEVLTAIAKNPKTPSQIALGLIEKLRTPDVKRMANVNGGFREILRTAALREYLKRTAGRGS